ncbi:unnamed protein product [Diatraea saccharalis]|uniref:Uncharacterized protein n=1 Tax=Diatraea saccharalis TaxID=40085 RepID=A0A9N9WGE0_9NEOP|nr:unnamed protein product [Diatraea saccharalis]
MFWTAIVILTCLIGVRSEPTSCTEDSQCSSGFYCEASARFCRECLRCEDFKRESPMPTDVCVNLVHVYPEGLCMPHDAENTTELLPLYAWVAIAAGLVLMVVILCLFSKMKKFKIAYAATDQSLQTIQRVEDVLLRPPAYHDIDNRSPAPPRNYAETPIMHKLDESPHSNVTLPSPVFRRCENSDSQYARIFNNPVYVREPQHEIR